MMYQFAPFSGPRLVLPLRAGVGLHRRDSRENQPPPFNGIMAEALLIPQFEQDLSDYALKSYVDSAVANKDVGVTTFNGRKGAVSPQSGDYTYSMVGAASSGHNHSGTYSESGHTHNYAAANHTHSYAASNHSHDYAASNHTHTITGSSHTHSDYASSTHSHSNYASSSHTHSYASTNHSHSDYASSSHTHSGYASSTHTHSYASSSHTHSGYASSSHTHSASDISDLDSGGGGLTDYFTVNFLGTCTSTEAYRHTTTLTWYRTDTESSYHSNTTLTSKKAIHQYSTGNGTWNVLIPGNSVTTRFTVSPGSVSYFFDLTVRLSATGVLSFSAGYMDGTGGYSPNLNQTVTGRLLFLA